MKQVGWVLIIALLLPALALAQDPPTAFDMLSPTDGLVVHSADVTLTWSASTDPQGGGITYTVEVAEDAGFTVNLQSFVTTDTSYFFNYLSHGDGFYWRVTAEDGESLTTAATTASFDFNVDLTVRDFVRGFSLWTPAVVPDVPGVGDNLDDDISGLYQVFSFSNATGYQYATAIEHGEAYWLAIAFDEEATIQIDGAAYADDEFELDLDQAWNFIGFPYMETGDILDWTVTDSDGMVRSMTGAADEGWIIPTVHTSWATTNQAPIPFDAGTQIRPWDGFWLLTREAGLTLTIPNPALVPAPATTQDANPNGWNIHPVVKLDGEPITAVRMGVADGASAGFDPMYDVPRAPAGPEPTGIEAYVDRPSWLPTLEDRFIGDVRAPFEANQTMVWEIVVEGSGALSLSIPDVGELPTGYEISVTDLLTNTTFDPTQLGDYAFDGSRTFSVEITAGATAVDGPISAQPVAFEVRAAYPNPFNPAVTVPFTLPDAGDVSVRLVNPLGRVVSDLTQSFSAGSHVVTVNGASLPTGMYFLTVQSAVGQHTQKVMLLK